jgi:murein DD-endopeptidase MepM/ murein hydrolase activator NlpD
MLVLAVAPLAMHRAIADVNATGESRSGSALALSGTVGSAGAEAPANSVRGRDLPPLVHYRVSAADTIDSLATQAGITVDTLVQVNHLTSPPLLTPGEMLVVPPVDGTMIPVEPTETLGEVARHFRMDASTIRVVNDLRLNGQLPTELFIPAISTDAVVNPTVSPDLGGVHQRVIRFGWPTKGIITQYFWQFHPGIDIANDIGTPEVAADGGQVIFAGWGSYGIYVEIDHGNGFHTIYGHMSRAVVSTGQTVSKGQLIGLMGMTGRATGPHLHFELHYQGVPQNPLDLLS